MNEEILTYEGYELYVTAGFMKAIEFDASNDKKIFSASQLSSYFAMIALKRNNGSDYDYFRMNELEGHEGDWLVDFAVERVDVCNYIKIGIAEEFEDKEKKTMAV